MAHLKSQSKELKISVNHLILKLVEQGMGRGEKPKRVVYHDLDFLFGTWTAKECKEFEERTKIFEKIDEEMWR